MTMSGARGWGDVALTGLTEKGLASSSSIDYFLIYCENKLIKIPI